MNANQIVNMIIRKVMSRGINAGINRIAGGGSHQDDLTPDERRRAKKGKKTANQAQRSMRMFRRFF